MELKYVGDMPIVSKHGVSFDHTQPDKYMYLHAATELIEALNYGPTQTTEHLYNANDKDVSSSEIMRHLKKYVKDIDAMFEEAENKAHAFVKELLDRVEENEHLSSDEKLAWSGNIKMMKDYYYQYVFNSTAYEAALQALSDEIHDGKIEEICVPMFKNYGLVLHDLVSTLEQRKSPIDAKVIIEQKDDKVIGSLCISHV